ncbi:TNFAIP3-interacting protein 3 [Xenopus laevis]|uniref:TNFAIP3-interacting protein 3 n=2 Tax=Xenopus laevis TaxID=8355 RepID=A0A8J0UPI3_XENLA|nr:TNFAIP3-interacting protein 3 [Xenopus laevis]
MEFCNKDVMALDGQQNVSHDAVRTLGNQTETERCESVELNTDICMQIQRNNMLKKGEDRLSVYKHQACFSSTLCSFKILKKTDPCCDLQVPETQCLRQTRKNGMTFEAYQHKIYMLEKQKAELLQVNKQWDQQFRKMKLFYETTVSELQIKLSSCQEQDLFKEGTPLEKDKLIPQLKIQDTHNAELLKMKEENQRLRKQNALYSRKREQYKHEIHRLNQVLEATQKGSLQRCQACLEPTNVNIDYEELLTQNEILKEQIKIYEEDFKRERADRERISEEKGELQQLNQQLLSQFSKISTEKKEMTHNNQRQHAQSQLCCSPTGKYGNLEHLAQNKDCVNRPYHEPHKRNNLHHKTHVPDYQWYVPDQLPPDVQQKENEAKLY